MSVTLADVSPAADLLARGTALLRQRNPRDAVAVLLRCTGLAPDRADAWYALGTAFFQDGAPLRALGALGRANRLVPRSLDYALGRAEMAHHANVGEAELSRLADDAADDPLNPAPLAATGLLLHRLGRHVEAADSLEAASTLDPADARLWALLGGVLARGHLLGRAEAAMRRALALDPANHGLRHDLGVALMRMHRFGAARAELAFVREARGGDATLLCNLANATLCLGLQDEALAIAREAATLTPDSPLAHRAVVNTLPYVADVSATELLAGLRRCASTLPREPYAHRFENPPDPDRPLRVGLLSGMLKTHPVGWLTIAGFENLNPHQFALIGLADTMANDALSRRFRAVTQAWHPIAALDDEALAAAARVLEIDVLIDLGGYGDLGRLSACARRLAPVQVKWVGMQNHSTGLAEMDWFVTDDWETPPSLAHTYSERLLRLPDGYVCYSPPAYAPDVTPLPAQQSGHVTFGCFTNLAKVTPRVVVAWAAILGRIPNARLVVKSHAFADAATAARLRDAFAALGVAATRLEWRGPSPHRDFLSEYGGVDIALDPFPYTGGLTTCEALWMGVPTVTLPGETFAARHSLSHLSNVGLGDWVAGNVADYVALAEAKARDLDGLAALRRSLRARVKASPLCDARRFGVGLGAALRFVWRDWCGAD
ncbi:MAG: tetratricopeptide repeat protein [Acetobacteraceae bacterium]